jgi:phospholipid/cholesterol/gamma-HCH transport system substrate-binding protein
MLINNQSNTVVPRVEIDQIVSQMDPATRAKLTALIPQLNNIVKGQGTQNTQETLQSAEPAVKALAQVLNAVGADGQTLHQLVTDMAGLSTRLVNRQGDLTNTVSGLDQSMSAIATQTGSLSSGINQLPSTLSQAQATLDQVPGTTQAALPLLSDLNTTSADLPAFSAKLEPVLTALQPVSQKLIPTFLGLDNLLHYTPALVNTANATVPQVTQAATEVQPAVSFLRPYTPELAGFLTNWGNTFSTFDNTGHLVPVPVVFGATSSDVNVPGTLASLGLPSSLGSLLPSLSAVGSTIETTRPCGQLVDAAGACPQ